MLRLKKPLLLAGGLSLALCLTALADSDDRRAREAGPEDGILCCNGVIPFLFHHDEVLTTTGRAGIFRSERRGERWQRSMNGLVAPNGVSPFVGFLCQAPSQPRLVYALAGLGVAVTPFNGLFSSDDFGETWTRRGQVNTGFGFNTCAVDATDPGTVYVSGFDDTDSASKTWKSTDGGRTVQEFANLPACAAGGRVHPRRGILYVVKSECVAASTDGGVSFHLLPVPQDLPGAFDASPDGRAIFLSTIDASFNTTATFRSTDGGASFVPVSGLPNGFGPLAFDPTDLSRIYTSDGLLRVSTDGGLSFALLPASNDPRFFGSFPIGEIGADPRGSVYLTTLAGPFRTDDRGQTFRPLLDGFRATAVQDLAFDADGKLLVGVLHTQMVFRQTHGRTFRPIGNTPIIDLKHASSADDYDAASVAASPTDANVILVATSNSGLGLFRTDDGGRSWTAPAVPESPAFYGNSRMAFPTSSRVYLASPTFPPGLYRSDDAGRSFAQLSSLRLGAIAVDSTDSNVLYVGTYVGSAGLFKSTDGGQTLQSLGQPGSFSALHVDRGNPQLIYAGARFGQVIRSLDGGQTFAPANNGLAGAGVHGLAQDAHGTLFVWLRAGGLFASHDGASTWHEVDTGEALRRSGVEAGRGSLVADPHHPGRVYLGNAGVIQVGAGGDEDRDD
jgi:photosystem II stability/assembly factor-like uncharacterized protein